MQRVRFAIWLFIVAAIVFVGYKFIPVLWGSVQFRSQIEEQARRSTYTKETPQEIQAVVLHQAEELDLPVQPEDIEVQRLPMGVSIKVDYTVKINLLVHEFELKYSPAVTNTRAY